MTRTAIARALTLWPLLLGVACGAPSRAAFLDLAFERDGAGDLVTLASVAVIDASPAPATLGLERSGISALSSPPLLGPLDVCIVETSPGGKLSALRLLDPGVSNLRGPSGEQGLDATPPAFGEGTGYVKRLESGEVDYQPGGAYELSCAGAEAPLFVANMNAPVEFQVERLGFVTPGPGTATIPSGSDLEIAWSPGSDDDLYVVILAGDTRLACRVKDDGLFTVKAKHVRKLPLGPATLALERVRRFDLARGSTSTGTIPGYGRVALRYKYDIELQ